MSEERIKISPALPQFRQMAAKANLIAVSSNISLDLDTPVSIYYKLVGKDVGFILESVDTSQQNIGRYSFIGAEPFVHMQVFPQRLLLKENDLMRCLDGDPAATIKEYMASFCTAVEDDMQPLANGGLVGYLNYDIAASFDRIRGMELKPEKLLGQFMLCRVMVVFDQLKKTARLICLVDTEGDLAEKYKAVEEKLLEIREKLYKPVQLPAEKKSIAQEKIDFLQRYGKMPAAFSDCIRKIREHIFAGDVFQLVPSRRFKARITKDPFLFYRRLRQVNPSPYMFYLNFDKLKLVGASPEMLVKVTGHSIYTYPIAGTRKRGHNEAEDASLAAGLQQDVKECAEHSMLVDLARNDLGRISEAGTVQVAKLKHVEFFSHVMHMVSEVTGRLKPGYTPMDVLKACFPAGTVSGAPKLRAMEIINGLEAADRETYAGTVGYMDFCGNMDMCITLRTMRIENDETAVIQSGAGIVADSVPEKEYQEILQKSKALFEVVEEVENDVAAFR